MTIPRVTVRDILRAAEKASGVPVEVLIGPSRRFNLMPVRAACARMAVRRGFSLSQVGRVMCRDHTTILHHRDSKKDTTALEAAVEAVLQARPLAHPVMGDAQPLVEGRAAP